MIFFIGKEEEKEKYLKNSKKNNVLLNEICKFFKYARI